MVHLGEPLRIHGLPHPPGVVGEALKVCEVQRQAMLFDEEKPVAAPRHVAAHRPEAGHGDPHAPGAAVAGDVVHRDPAVRVQLGAMDLIMLDVQGTVVERLDAPAADEGDEEDDIAGPIAIAMDLNDGVDSPTEDSGPTGDNPAQ